MPEKVYSLGIIGCGNMGEAILKGVLNSSLFLPSKVLVSDKKEKRRKYLKEKYKVEVTPDNLQVAGNSQRVLLAVKPQDMEEVVTEIRETLKGEILLISIAAGISTSYLEKRIGKKIPVVRIMPNLPLKVKKGICAISGGKYARERHLEETKKIFSSVGEVFQVGEELMDGVTALFGSGPAYVFYFLESLIESGKEMGLPLSWVEKLSPLLVEGALKLLSQEKESPRSLRLKVTSPGGTTERALSFLKEKRWKEILKEAIKKASQRSKELGKIFS